MNEQRLEFAAKIGADVTLNPEKVKLEEYFRQNEKAGVVFETAGHPITQVQAITLAGKGGKVIYVGTSHRAVSYTHLDLWEELCTRNFSYTLDQSTNMKLRNQKY